MFKRDRDDLNRRITSATQTVMGPPKLVRIKEYFPQDNAVTVIFEGKGVTAGLTPTTSSGEVKFPLGYRGDVSESMAPQPGDLCLIFFTGMQYKRGFALLTNTEGGSRAMQYVPVRGNWALA
tara:strand:+ start:147 stop:512 length:366 start_codon:yes stop_codon:yes gene_type:complete